jgi:hypothetical protein
LEKAHLGNFDEEEDNIKKDLQIGFEDVNWADVPLV